MLKYLSIFISYCDYHLLLPPFFAHSSKASISCCHPASAAFQIAGAELIVSAFYPQFLSCHQALCQLLPCSCIHQCHTGSIHIDLLCTFFLRNSFVVNQPDTFKFIQTHDNTLLVLFIRTGRKTAILWSATNASFLCWSRHMNLSFMFFTYVNNSIAHFPDIAR